MREDSLPAINPSWSVDVGLSVSRPPNRGGIPAMVRYRGQPGWPFCVGASAAGVPGGDPRTVTGIHRGPGWRLRHGRLNPVNQRLTNSDPRIHVEFPSAPRLMLHQREGN